MACKMNIPDFFGEASKGHQKYQELSVLVGNYVGLKSSCCPVAHFPLWHKFQVVYANQGIQFPT